jgi:general secretion pathway protein F
LPIYEYKGIRKSDGKGVKGLKDADGEKSLRAALKREGVLVTEIRDKRRGRKRGEIDLKNLFGKRVSRLDIALATRQLATLSKAGISLVEALSAVIDQSEKPDLKGAVTDVRDQVNQGMSLSKAFSRHPRFFNSLFCNMVNAGEQSGTLDQVLMRLADFIEAQNKLRNKVFSAMAYPVIMLFIMVIMIGIMMVVVVPKVTSIFENFGRELPWYTELLIAMSNFFRGFWWLVLLLIVVGIIGFRRWKNSESGKANWHRFVLWTPIFGGLAMMIAISRFAKTLATLLTSGVPIVNAMDITRGVLGNVILEQVVSNATASIQEGESIAEPLKDSGRFPPIVTHMIAIGERSGQLESMLENVASAYDSLVDTRVSAMTSLLEPIMIVVMGISVGGIALSILMPLIQMNEFIK